MKMTPQADANQGVNSGSILGIIRCDSNDPVDKSRCFRIIQCAIFRVVKLIMKLKKAAT